VTRTYVRNNVERAMQMMEALKANPCTLAYLAEISGLSTIAVARWLKSVRKTVHISGYTEDARGRLFTALWVWGKGKDAPRPGPQKTPAERMQAVRERRRAAQANADLFG
jgi:hypothetical protein